MVPTYTKKFEVESEFKFYHKNTMGINAFVNQFSWKISISKRIARSNDVMLQALSNIHF